jgi:hypothetical protein
MLIERSLGPLAVSYLPDSGDRGGPTLLRGRDVDEIKELKREGLSIRAISRLTHSDKQGAIWTYIELERIVVDYFAMLADDLAGRCYSKAPHNAMLTETIGRTGGSADASHRIGQDKGAMATSGLLAGCAIFRGEDDQRLGAHPILPNTQ